MSDAIEIRDELIAQGIDADSIVCFTRSQQYRVPNVDTADLPDVMGYTPIDPE